MITDAPSGAAQRLTGALAVSLTGLLWVLAAGAVGLSRLSGLVAAVVVLAALAITAAIIDFAVRTRRAAPTVRTREFPTDWQHRVRLVAIVAAVATVVSIAVLIPFGLAGLITPSLCLILGLALYPLANLLDQPEFRATAIALVIIAIVGFVVVAALGTSAGQCVVGLGAALALWGTAVLSVRHG